MTDSAASTPKSYHTDPTLYLYTSLTAGSSHIITATSRLETILKANKIPFQALDVATDEKARMLWGRRAGKKKLPGLVRMGMIVADLEEVEEWNEYGEIKDNLQFSAPKAAPTPSPSAANTPSKSQSIPSAGTPLKTSTASANVPPDQPSSTAKTTTASESPSKAPSSNSSTESPITVVMRQAGLEAAKKAGNAKAKARTEALESLKAKDSGLQKLDNSAPTGMPPPSGTTEASNAIKGETGEAKVAGKADEVPTTEETEVLEGKGQTAEILTSTEAEAAANESILEDKSHIVLVGQGRTPDGGTPRSEMSEEGYEALKKAESAGSGFKQSISATDEGEELPGKRTQEQGAADGGEAGNSVAD